MLTLFFQKKKKKNEGKNKWKKPFISSTQSELLLNNTTNLGHLRPHDAYSAFFQLIIMNMM